MGGQKQSPTYKSLGDHTESIEIDFDPAAVSYEELVRQFFAAHSPLYPPFSRQYRSAVFVHGKQQRAVVERVKAELEREMGATLHTAIEDAGQFWLAEDYHQKYYLKHDAVFAKELRRLFGADEAALINSTAVARLCGLVGGFAPASFSSESVDQLGLSEAGEKHARALLSGSERPAILCK